MSPLIATILLMAFAVALGAVIMNWSASIPESGLDCSEIELQIRSVCTSSGQLQLNLRNVGTTDISEIGISISDPPIEIPFIRIGDSQLNRGQTLETSINTISLSEQASVGIIPSLAGGDMCPEPVHTVQPVPPC